MEKMNPILKKILAALLGAVIGSGITIKISDSLAVNCKPIMEAQ